MTNARGFGSRWAVAATVLAVALVASACGTTPFLSAYPPEPATPKGILDAMHRTTAEKTARLSLSASVSGLGADDSGVATDGVVNLATGDSDSKLLFTGAASAVLGRGIEIRILHRLVYTQIPAPLPKAGFWQVSSSASGTGASAGLRGLGESDPASSLAYFETVSSGVRMVGTEKIRNVETTHYRWNADLELAIARLKASPAARDQFRKLLTASPQLSGIPIDVWLDGRGLVRRIQLSLHEPLTTAVPGFPVGTRTVVTIAVELYDFGVAVHVQAPPASEITASSGAGAPGTP